jgi:hypothetical protein
MNMSARADGERFQSGANKYAAYLETPEGRLRFDLAWANLHDFLLQAKEPLCALDLEGGRERRRFDRRDLVCGQSLRQSRAMRITCFADQTRRLRIASERP